MAQDSHLFTGMKRDTHPIRQDSKFLWEAHGIRFTAMDDSTLLSLTNEKGTKKELEMTGNYLGHCVLGEYLIVFTADTDSQNYIYRVTNSNDTWTSERLYKGTLNMDTDHPIETLGIYEGEFVQKVYWVDGKNQPRVINVVADKLYEDKLNTNNTDDEKQAIVYPEGCFEFVQELQLKEEVTVTRTEGGGAFSPGVIQYAFSYYNKYGQESNIFYITPLYNVSPSNRAGSPEETVANSFHIKITNFETRFQYLRIYSIHRTSYESTPAVKIVTDIEINLNSKTTAINYIDTGLNGDDLDPTKMLYIGGESIIANAITTKDNTLFLGNIELIRPSILDSVKAKLISEVVVYQSFRRIKLGGNNLGTFYDYNNQLANGNPATFKVGETYRIGVQFQHKNGKWSEPVWIGKDLTIDETNKPKIITYSSGDKYLFVPAIELNISAIEGWLKSNGYIKARSLIVVPSVYDRTIMCQGILCPTVFSIKDRLTNIPFAQSSWFFRPISEAKDNTVDIEKGATITSKHLAPLLSGRDRGAEIQNMVDSTFVAANYAAKKDKATNNNAFFVDQSIVTFHSPDIEFDDSTQQALNNNDFELKIVGIVDFQSNAGDITLQTSSAVPAPNDNGFFHKSMLSTNYENKSLVSGMFYKSHIIDDDGSDIQAYKADKDDWELNWLVYPWQRNGSLNNDTARAENKGTRTSMLKKKTISNIKFSPSTTWLNSTQQWTPAQGITPVSIFNSNEMALVKIPTPKNSELSAMNYYGNIDTLVTTDTKYTFYLCPNEGVDLGKGKAVNPFTNPSIEEIDETYRFVGDRAEQLKLTKEPVRMKYKSTPHAVFAFNFLKEDSSSSPIILPKINNTLNKAETVTSVPFWIDSDVDADIIYSKGSEAINIFNIAGGTPADITGWLDKKYPLGTEDDILYAIMVDEMSLETEKLADLYSWTTVQEEYYYSQTDHYTINVKRWSKMTLTSSDVGKQYYTDEEDTVVRYWKVVDRLGDGTLFILLSTKSDIPTTNYKISQTNITMTTPPKSFLYLAELRRKNAPDNRFGGDTEEALKNNSWIPAGPTWTIGDTEQPNVRVWYGDTYYQRYDCLKTYPYADDDENSIVEIASFMCETRVNIEGRYDKNRGLLSNIYMSPTNFNLLNDVYNQKDNFFNYRILDKQYYRNTKYPSQVLWSLEKSYLEDVDSWTTMTLANSTELDGKAGTLTSLNVFNDTLLGFQEKSLNQIMFNSRVQIPTSDGVPVEISNNYKLEGSRVINDVIGCQSKWSIAKSSSGLYFVDNSTDTLYLYNGELKNVSDAQEGRYWFKERHTSGDDYLRLNYDFNNKDLYVISRDKEALCYSEMVGTFTSLMPYKDTVMFNVNNEWFSLKNDSSNTVLWSNFKGDYNYFYGKYSEPSFTYICNDNATYTKIFDTIEYRADIYDKDHNLLHKKTFDYIKAANEYQESSLGNDFKKKFRVWRAQIPRQKLSRARIRNPWAAITLGFNKPLDKHKTYGADNYNDNFNCVSINFANYAVPVEKLTTVATVIGSASGLLKVPIWMRLVDDEHGIFATSLNSIIPSEHANQRVVFEFDNIELPKWFKVVFWNGTSNVAFRLKVRYPYEENIVVWFYQGSTEVFRKDLSPALAFNVYDKDGNVISDDPYKYHFILHDISTKYTV